MTRLTASKIIAFGQLPLNQEGVSFELNIGRTGSYDGLRRDPSFLFSRPIKRTGPKIAGHRKHNVEIDWVGSDATRTGCGLLG